MLHQNTHVDIGPIDVLVELYKVIQLMVPLVAAVTSRNNYRATFVTAVI